MPKVGVACSGLPAKRRFGSLSSQGSGSRTCNLCSQIPQFSLRSYYAIACLSCGANAKCWCGVLWDPGETSVRILEPAGNWEPDMGAGHVTLGSQIPQFSLRYYYGTACLACGANVKSWCGVLWAPGETSVRILEPAGIWEPDMGAGHVTLGSQIPQFSLRYYLRLLV